MNSNVRPLGLSFQKRPSVMRRTLPFAAVHGVDYLDYPGLVALCESEVQRCPDDLRAAERLADAYMLNKKYEKVIEFAARIHRECPDIPSFQYRIMDALRALGKNENDFD